MGRGVRDGRDGTLAKEKKRRDYKKEKEWTTKEKSRVTDIWG